MDLYDIGRQVTDSIIPPTTLRVGRVYQHPTDGLIRILSGYYRDPAYGRISNFWTWEVLSTQERKSGYGASWPEYHEGQPCGCAPGETCEPIK